MQREARWVFWGRELSLSQCWIDVTDARAAAPGGANTALCKQPHRRPGYHLYITTSIISIRKTCHFGGHISFTDFYVESGFSLVPDQHHSRCCCRCVLEQDTLESCRDPGEVSNAGLIKGEKWATVPHTPGGPGSPISWFWLFDLVGNMWSY